MKFFCLHQVKSGWLFVQPHYRTHFYRPRQVFNEALFVAGLSLYKVIQIFFRLQTCVEVFLCCCHTFATATPLRIKHFSSVFRVSAQFQCIVSTHSQWVSAHSQWVSARSQWSRQRAKIFHSVQKIFCSAVSVGSQCIHHQIDGDCSAETAQWTQGDCSETLTLVNARILLCESYQV